MFLVVGATGLVGGEVCRQLAAAGMPVRALVRPTSDTAKVAALRIPGIEVVEGDVRDAASLAAACRDVEGVVCTISSMPFAYVPGVNDIETVDRNGVRQLIDAAGAAGVKRFVYTSFSGHLDIDFPLGNAKRQVERWVIDSGLEYTILRPSYFMEIWLSPAVGFDPVNAKATIYGAGEQPISWISAHDVATFAVAALTAPSAANAVLELGGPRPISPLEVVRIFESATGRPFEVTHVPEDALRSQQEQSADPMQQSFAGLMRCYALGDPIEMGKVADLLARPMMTVDAYAASLRTGVPTG